MYNIGFNFVSAANSVLIIIDKFYKNCDTSQARKNCSSYTILTCFNTRDG